MSSPSPELVNGSAGSSTFPAVPPSDLPSAPILSRDQVIMDMSAPEQVLFYEITRGRVSDGGSATAVIQSMIEMLRGAEEDAAALKFFLQRQIPLSNAPSELKLTPLCSAVVAGNVAACDLLLQAARNIKHFDFDEMGTALFSLILNMPRELREQAMLPILNLLLNHLRENNVQMALHKRECLQQFLCRAVQEGVNDARLYALVTTTIKHELLPDGKMVVGGQTSIDAVFGEFQQYEHSPAKPACQELVQMFATYSSNYVESQYGSFMHWCAQYSLPEVADIFISSCGRGYFTSSNLADTLSSKICAYKAKPTPLQIAYARNNIQMFQTLLAIGCVTENDLNAQDNPWLVSQSGIFTGLLGSKYTPFQLACQSACQTAKLFMECRSFLLRNEFGRCYSPFITAMKTDRDCFLRCVAALLNSFYYPAHAKTSIVVWLVDVMKIHLNFVNSHERDICLAVEKYHPQWSELLKLADAHREITLRLVDKDGVVSMIGSNITVLNGSVAALRKQIQINTHKATAAPDAAAKLIEEKEKKEKEIAEFNGKLQTEKETLKQLQSDEQKIMPQLTSARLVSEFKDRHRIVDTVTAALQQSQQPPVELVAASPVHHDGDEDQNRRLQQKLAYNSLLKICQGFVCPNVSADNLQPVIAEVLKLCGEQLQLTPNQHLKDAIQFNKNDRALLACFQTKCYDSRPENLADLLRLAFQSSAVDCFVILLEKYQCDPNVSDEHGKSLLLHIMDSDNSNEQKLQFMQILFEHGANIFYDPAAHGVSEGLGLARELLVSALQCAFPLAFIRQVADFIEAKVPGSLHDILFKGTFLHQLIETAARFPIVAMYEHVVELLHYLLGECKLHVNQQSVNSVTVDGETALHVLARLAMRGDCLAVVEQILPVLLQYGADPKKPDANGISVLDIIALDILHKGEKSHGSVFLEKLLHGAQHDKSKLTPGALKQAIMCILNDDSIANASERNTQQLRALEILFGSLVRTLTDNGRSIIKQAVKLCPSCCRGYNLLIQANSLSVDFSYRNDGSFVAAAKSVSLTLRTENVIHIEQKQQEVMGLVKKYLPTLAERCRNMQPDVLVKFLGSLQGALNQVELEHRVSELKSLLQSENYQPLLATIADPLQQLQALSPQTGPGNFSLFISDGIPTPPQALAAVCNSAQHEHAPEFQL